MLHSFFAFLTKDLVKNLLNNFTNKEKSNDFSPWSDQLFSRMLKALIIALL